MIDVRLNCIKTTKPRVRQIHNLYTMHFIIGISCIKCMIKAKTNSHIELSTRLSPLRFRVRSPVWWTRTQSSCEESKVNALPKVVGFLPRVLRFPPTGKVDRVG